MVDLGKAEPSAPTPPLVTDNAFLVLLAFDGLLLGALSLAMNPLHVGAVPVPIGVVPTLVFLPWLVRRAGEIDVRYLPGGGPLWAWLLAVVVGGLFGPGGDAMLPPQWPSLLLVAAGVVAGMLAMRPALMRGP